MADNHALTRGHKKITLDIGAIPYIIPGWKEAMKKAAGLIGP